VCVCVCVINVVNLSVLPIIGRLQGANMASLYHYSPSRLHVLINRLCSLLLLDCNLSELLSGSSESSGEVQ
jgi:hypothetical protein